LLDPASGRRTVGTEELSRHFTGVALELTPTAAFKPIDQRVRTRLGDLWSKLVNYRSAFVQVVALSLLLEVTALALPFFMQLTVMALISVPLMLVVLTATLMYIGFRLAVYPAIRRRTEEEIVARASEETYLIESIRAIRAIKLHVSEPMRENGWRNKYADVVSAGYRNRIYKIVTKLAEGLLLSGQYLLVVYL